MYIDFYLLYNNYFKYDSKLILTQFSYIIVHGTCLSARVCVNAPVFALTDLFLTKFGICVKTWSRESSVDKVTRLGAEQPKNRG